MPFLNVRNKIYQNPSSTVPSFYRTFSPYRNPSQISTASFTQLQQELQDRTLASTGDDAGMIGTVFWTTVIQPYPWLRYTIAYSEYLVLVWEFD